jgi:hypothetical protein
MMGDVTCGMCGRAWGLIKDMGAAEREVVQEVSVCGEVLGLGLGLG